jgi:prophage tail gpP-like protein
MLEVSGGFAVSITNFFKDQKSINLKMTSAVQLEANGYKLLDGWIDKIDVAYGVDSDRVEIYGRDKTCDLIDCTHASTPNEWKNQSVRNLIRQLCNPFSVSVVIDDSATSEVEKVIETYKASEGIPVSELIIELCRDIGVLPMTVGDGKLTITKSGTTSSNSGIVVGDNATACNLVQTNEARFSTYIVKGQGVGTSNKTRDDYISCNGSFDDAIVTRYRPKVSFAEGIANNALCKTKAIADARISAGLSRMATYNIHSWLQHDNRPWRVNQLVPVRDKIALIEKTMLVVAVDFIYDEEDGGDTARVSVVDTGTFTLSPSKLNIKSRFD